MKNPFGWAVSSIRHRGVGRTASVALNYLDNWLFDFRLGTDTAPVIELSRLEIDSDNKTFGHEYRATKARPLRKLIAVVPNLSGKTFVDFGCGKGKAVLVAAEFPFKRLVGLDFSADLCRVARENFEKVRGAHDAERVEFITTDVVDYQYRDDEDVFYFYNPFGPDVIEAVLQRLEQSLARHPRPVWILYFAPQYREVFDTCEFLTLEAYFVLGGADHLVYVNRLSERPKLPK